MVMKQIKVTDDVKAELDSLRYEKETYNLVIHRLIRECKRLFIENQRLNYDKDVLMKMLVSDDSAAADIGLEYKYIPFLESIIDDNILSDAERLNYLKKYFSEIDAVDDDLLLDCILIVKESNNISDGVLLEFESWIKSNQQ